MSLPYHFATRLPVRGQIAHALTVLKIGKRQGDKGKRIRTCRLGTGRGVRNRRGAPRPPSSIFYALQCIESACAALYPHCFIKGAVMGF
jgi:hypothetical protein